MDEIGRKAVQVSTDAPSIWFVNFPTADAASQGKRLDEYMQAVLNYRCWASSVWWKTVFQQSKIPQGNSRLATRDDRRVSKDIECNVRDLHTKLIEAALEDFVKVTPRVVSQLEKILQPLGESAVDQTNNAQGSAIICERYVYIPEAEMMRSYIRILSVNITQSMRDVQKVKQTAQTIKCNIEFSNYDVDFGKEMWDQTAGELDEGQKTATLDFVKRQTINCDP